MKTTRCLLIITILFFLEINGSVNEIKKPTVYQDQVALKVALYLKDPSDLTKKYLCNQVVLKSSDNAFWDNGNTDIYILLCPGGDLIQHGIGKSTRDPFGRSFFSDSKFVLETKKYLPLKENKASFEKDNFVFECERITIKVPVPETSKSN
jgi:hypothetical protein